MRTPEELKKHKRKQNIIAIAILIFGTLFSYILLGPKGNGDSEDIAKNVAALVKTEIISENAKVSKLEKPISLSAGGAEANIVSEYSGRITSVNFEVGEQVSRGQVLATFDQSDNENSLKASFESSSKNYEILQDSLEKTKDLVEENIDLAKRAVKIAEMKEDQASTDSEKDLAGENLKIAKDQKDQAKISADIQVNSLEAQLEQARLAVQQSEIAYEKTFIKAPISGVVTSKSISAGDFLSLGQKTGSVVGNGKIEARLFLNGDEINRIKVGDPVDIEIGEENYQGKIVSKSDIANSANSRFEVKIASLDDISQKTNQTGRVTFNIYLNSSNEGSFFAPLDAVIISQNKKEVFIVEDGKATVRQVELGKIIGTQIEVLNGLSNGDVLIIENSRNLQNGQSVKISN